jgi:integrase/recombinase XerD
VQFLNCVGSRKHRAILTTCYTVGLRTSEAVALAPSAVDSKRMVIRVEQGKGQKDRYTIIVPKTPRNPARLVASGAAKGLALSK